MLTESQCEFIKLHKNIILLFIVVLILLPVEIFRAMWGFGKSFGKQGDKFNLVPEVSHVTLVLLFWNFEKAAAVNVHVFFFTFSYKVNGDCNLFY